MKTWLDIRVFGLCFKKSSISKLLLMNDLLLNNTMSEVGNYLALAERTHQHIFENVISCFMHFVKAVLKKLYLFLYVFNIYCLMYLCI